MGAKGARQAKDQRIAFLEGQAKTMEGTIDMLAKQNQFLVKEIDFGVYFVQSLMGNIVSIFNMLKEENVIEDNHHKELMDALGKFEGLCRNRFNEGKPPPGITDKEAPTEPTIENAPTSQAKEPETPPSSASPS